MAALNYKHLHYFWVVAKAGSIARASERLHVTPQTISGQLSLFEDNLGQKLFVRHAEDRAAGQGVDKKDGHKGRDRRRFELTDAGQSVLTYAEEIFALGQELGEALRRPLAARPHLFRVGVSDAVAKSVAYRLLEPAMTLAEPIRIVCREGKLADLLAEMAVHRLDIVIADSALPASLSVRGYSHLLGGSGTSFFAAPALAKTLSAPFPRCLDGAPLLLPGEDAAVRPRLLRWLDSVRVQPRVAGEFDDGALMNAFGQAGAGVFAAPTAIEQDVRQQYGVEVVGRTGSVREEFYALSEERRLSHPAVVAISSAARSTLFGARRRTKAAKPVSRRQTP